MERSATHEVECADNKTFIVDRPVAEIEWNSLYRISPDALTPLTQVRNVFEETDILAESIAREGLYYPLIVGYLDEEHASCYLADFNRNWRTDYQISNMTAVKGIEGIYYLPIIAGGRRFGAIRHLMTKGCISHQEAFGEGGCYHYHVPDQRVSVHLKPNISFDDAFKIQMNENTHMRVPPHREAQVLSVYFRNSCERHSDYKPADLARELGRPYEFIRRALKYVDAPEQIQRAVDEGALPYPVACEIARLNGLVPEMDQLRWAVRWGIRKYETVAAFAREISREIFNIKGGQTTMFELFFSEDQQKTIAEAQRRAVFKNTVEDLSDVVEHLKKIGGLVKTGVIERGNSPYTERLTTEAHLRVIRLAEPWLNHLNQLTADLINRGQETQAIELTEALKLAQRTESLLLVLQQEQTKNADTFPLLVN